MVEGLLYKAISPKKINVAKKGGKRHVYIRVAAAVAGTVRLVGHAIR